MTIGHFFNNIESYICRLLLVVFVTLLMAQIVAREVFGFSMTWIEELSVFLFVWFAYFGASHAAKISAHNRVLFQFKFFPPIVRAISEGVADLIWLAFNMYFVYLSYQFIFHKMNPFWKSQTLGIPMKYCYLVLPIAFTLMSFRIIQVNYLKWVKGVDIRDPDAIEMENLAATMDIEADKENKTTAHAK
jgi:C4-dicarboxylate transporter DctQ subunit